MPASKDSKLDVDASPFWETRGKWRWKILIAIALLVSFAAHIAVYLKLTEHRTPPKPTRVASAQTVTVNLTQQQAAPQPQSPPPPAQPPEPSHAQQRAVEDPLATRKRPPHKHGEKNAQRDDQRKQRPDPKPTPKPAPKPPRPTPKPAEKPPRPTPKPAEKPAQAAPSQSAAASKKPAPESRSQSASQQSASAAKVRNAQSRGAASDRQNWNSQAVAKLEAAKRYPPAARQRRQQDVIRVMMTVNRQGRIVQHRIVMSHHVMLLDREVDRMMSSVKLPPLPDSIPGETITVMVPINFRVTGS
ncbi:energy transducer TonB [Carnimonas bestiolae]|uniref:energy transducer TonB n=1 Tax=Carnimonas bestiolae TaxID=3402172 RepID=UPI003EDB94A3